LPRPIVLPDVPLKLSTLADVRTLIHKRLPAPVRAKQTWRYVADRLREAAAGGNMVDVTVPLRMVLTMEGIVARLSTAGSPRRPTKVHTGRV
jgi:hypothetical protein